MIHLSQIIGADSSDVALTLTNLGINYRLAGDKRKAEETFREALGMYTRVDPGNPMIWRIRRYSNGFIYLLIIYFFITLPFIILGMALPSIIEIYGS